MTTQKIPQVESPTSTSPTPATSTGPHPKADRVAPVAGAPWLPRDYVPRLLLWSMLDSSTSGAVTMVVAPPGAGKTLGVAGWLQHSPSGPDAIWISAGKAMTTRQLETALADARSDAENPRIVVLDDAHQLSAACVRLLDQQLGHDPDGLRLVLLTRWDLALSRLVPELLGHLSVIRGDVLKLSEDEARLLIGAHARTDSPEVRDAIIARAEGWCAAVVLAARASAAAPSNAEFVRKWQNSGLGVADLVAGEVFAALTPQGRHLLLCTAAEPVLTPETAVHLTRDPLAGEVLSTMESTGLLVSRVGDGRDTDDGVQDGHDAQFRIHPLLLEVTRRRLNAGGVDVQQANSTVLRAARLDLVRGDVLDGFRRLVALGEYAAAAAVLAEHGPRLLAHGDATWVHQFVRRAGTVLEDHPETWATIACAHWVSGDLRGAGHWSNRVLRQHTADPGSVPAAQALCMRLHRSRTGLEPVREAADAARQLVGPERALPGGDPFLAILLLELGAAENWLGDLSVAEAHLSESVMVSRTEQLTLLTAEALTHLALTQFMAGRESACADLAHQAIDLCEREPSVPAATRARADVAIQLAALQSTPWPGSAKGDPHHDSGLPLVPDDLAGRFWHRTLAARLALVSGSLAEAKQRLEMPFENPQVPQHLQVSLLVERALHALVAANREALRTTADQLADADAPGELALVEGALADLDGDLRGAAALYLEASRARCHMQPATMALGLVCAAQLHMYLIDAPSVRELLGRAATATESRRNVVPFLGWSAHGNRVGLLLSQGGGVNATPWTSELREMCAPLPGVTTIFRPLVGTARELRSVVEPAVTPVLSPREQEVLSELARGSTYSDIAANLFVSENTVKTHISSVYAKLSVGRRSEALAVARKLHLL